MKSSMMESHPEFPSSFEAGDQPVAQEKPMRIWTSGVVVLEPYSSTSQSQQFANWAQSRLTYKVGPIDQPPDGYTGVTYETAARSQTISEI